MMHPPQDWNTVTDKEISDRKALRSFLILILVAWLVFFTVVGMIRLVGVLL